MSEFHKLDNHHILDESITIIYEHESWTIFPGYFVAWFNSSAVLWHTPKEVLTKSILSHQFTQSSGGSTRNGIMPICAGVTYMPGKECKGLKKWFMTRFLNNFCLYVENILLHDSAHLRWCDTCAESRAKTDNDCFIVSIFAESVQFPTVILRTVLLRLLQICTWVTMCKALNTKRNCEENSCSKFFTCLAWENQSW